MYGQEDDDMERYAQHRDKAEQQLRETLIDVSASLAAAISLLESGGKCAAPSNKIFEMMLTDYRRSLARARRLLKTPTSERGAP